MKQSLTSFSPLHTGSQFQLAAGQLICVVQLAVHIWLVPFNTPEKNLLQFVGLALSALIAFAGLVLNYLTVSLNEARLAGQVFKAQRLEAQIDAVKMALSAITIGGVVIIGIIQAVKTGFKVYHKRDKIANTLASGVRKVRAVSRITNRNSADVELPEVQPSSVEPVPSLDRIDDIDRRERLARLSMNRSQAASAAGGTGGAGAANTPGEGDPAGSPGGEFNEFCFENPLDSVDSKIVDSTLEDVGSLAAHSKSERFARMRSFNNGKRRR